MSTINIHSLWKIIRAVSCGWLRTGGMIWPWAPRGAVVPATGGFSS